MLNRRARRLTRPQPAKPRLHHTSASQHRPEGGGRAPPALGKGEVENPHSLPWEIEKIGAGRAQSQMQKDIGGGSAERRESGIIQAKRAVVSHAATGSETGDGDIEPARRP